MTYICFELYRPPRPLKLLETGYDDDSQVMADIDESDLCQTDFDITITYRQSRPAIQKRIESNSAEEQEESELFDSVQLEYSGSVVWESPISAEFPTTGRVERAFPSGSRHPSNYVSSDDPSVSVDEGSELALINGERTSSRCVLQSTVARDGIELEIAKVRFEVRNLGLLCRMSVACLLSSNRLVALYLQEKNTCCESDDSGCELRLVSSTVLGSPGVLYAANESDGSRVLTKGTKFSLTYTVEPTILDEYIKGSVSTCLGVICVDWMPTSIPAAE